MKPATFKSLLTLVVFVLSAFFPMGEVQSIQTTVIICSFSFVLGLVIPHIMHYNSLRNHLVKEKPYWNNKISQKNPLSYLQLISVLIVAFGIGGLIGGIIVGQSINFVGIVLSIIGFGILIGIHLEVVGIKNKSTINAQNTDAS